MDNGVDDEGDGATDEEGDNGVGATDDDVDADGDGVLRWTTMAMVTAMA